MNVATAPQDKITAPSNEWVQSRKPVLLTFDDGPCPKCTPLIMDTLLEFGIKAVFFVVGTEIQKPLGRDIVLEIVSAGHFVGNHSYSHMDLACAPQHRILFEIEQMQVILQSLGIFRRLFRPPYGKSNEQVAEILNGLQFWTLGWNVNTLDWKYRSNDWVAYGVQQVQRNKESVVLLHDIHATTAGNLAVFIRRLLDIGCSFPSLFCLTDGNKSDSNERWVSDSPGWMVFQGLPLFRPHHLSPEVP